MSEYSDFLLLAMEKILELASVVPLPVFVFFGSILEDIIAPIPSPLLQATAGTLARQYGYTWYSLTFLIILASAGKTLAACAFYYLADKLQDKLPDKFYSFLRIKKSEVQKFGKKLSKGRRDDIAIFLLRAWPISPATIISIASGFLKTNFKTFFVATFLGYLFPSALYLLAGFHGRDILEEFLFLTAKFVNLF